MKQLLYHVSFAIFFALLMSCTTDIPEASADVPPVAPLPTSEPDPLPETQPVATTTLDTTTVDSSAIVQKMERPSRGPAILTFDETSYTYDTIDQGDVIEYEFKFTNTGERPLTIKNVQGSCGCTIGSYPFLDIAPGERDAIKARFDSKGKQGPQFTTITVYSNAEDRVLSLKGVVRGPDGSVLPTAVGH